MARRSSFFVALLAALGVGSGACVWSMGDFSVQPGLGDASFPGYDAPGSDDGTFAPDVAPDVGPGRDAAMRDAASDSPKSADSANGGGPAEAAPPLDAAPLQCGKDADCVALLGQTTPAGCASATCNATGICVFAAVDQDGDTHPTAHCAAANMTAIQLGDDCDDSDPLLYPGHSANCSELPGGGAITYPGGTPKGACKYGQKSCLPDHTVGACMGAVAPSQNLCDGKDEACTGDPQMGCACQVGKTQPCGPAAVGICHPGTQTCLTNATWGACSGAQQPLPRDCTSSADNDCDGKPDNTIDGVCQCAQGNSTTCNTHPGYDGVGICSAGSASCVVAADKASSGYGACMGGQDPLPRDCTSPYDNNCDGQADNTLDNVCTCAVGSTAPCQAHPGYDGVGICQAGSTTCVAGAGNSSSAYGACSGSVGPDNSGGHTGAGWNGSWDWNCDGQITQSQSWATFVPYNASYGSCSSASTYSAVCATYTAGTCPTAAPYKGYHCSGNSPNCGEYYYAFLCQPDPTHGCSFDGTSDLQYIDTCY